MQLASRTSVKSSCIFCAFRSAVYAFSTSAPSSSPIRSLRARRSGSKSSKNDRSLGRSRRWLPERPLARFQQSGLPYDSATSPFGYTSDVDHATALSKSEAAPLGDNERITASGRRLKVLRKRQPGISGGMDALRQRLDDDPILARLECDKLDLHKHYKEYREYILGRDRPRSSRSDPLMKRLDQAAARLDENGIDWSLTLGLFRKVVMSKFTEEDLAEHGKVASLAYPAEWFPATRGYKRKFHIHVGPTNSGKTYHALKRLEGAVSGLYAGPLRLLAYEVYMRLNARGIPCDLITGDDRRSANPDDDRARMVSCTVEMVPLNWVVDVAVIDEIQMIGSSERGWAWTQAVLGVQAREVHVCGEERAVPIMQELAALCGDEVHVHRYERLSPLKMMSRSLEGDIRNLRKGDCVVCFSIAQIHGLRQLIEKSMDFKVAMIYGGLPPETRAQQAQLFNDPESGYDILVASDAIGMGLNLSIKRIIFQASTRTVKGSILPLEKHEIKQIAGRAGRFSTAQQDIKDAASGRELELREKPLGLVSTMEKFDYPNISLGMEQPNTPILTAGIYPPASVIDKFSKLFPSGTPFSFIILQLYELAQIASRFHLCDPHSNVLIADTIENVTGLTLAQRMIICSAPSDPKKPGEESLLRAYARKVAKGVPFSILDVPELELELLEYPFKLTRTYLHSVEILHKGIVLWLWLSYRFDKIFAERELAMHAKVLVEKRIAEVLAKMSFSYEASRRDRQRAMLEMLSIADPKADAGVNESVGEIADINAFDVDERPHAMKHS